MPPPAKKPWPRLLTPLLLYTLLATFLLWLLPPPIHFQFTTDNASRLFKPTTEPALVRLHTEKKNPTSINDYFIERVDLSTGRMNRIPLDPVDKEWIGDCKYIHSRDGSHILIMHAANSYTVSAWDGYTGKFLFQKTCQANSWKQMACTTDGSCIALVTRDGWSNLDIYNCQTEKAIGQIPCRDESNFARTDGLQFSLDGKWLLRRYGLPRTEVTEVFDIATLTAVHRAKDDDSTGINEIAPVPHGFWLSQWNRSTEQLQLSYLDAPTGKLTTLAPELSTRLDGFPHIFSDNAGCLYLLQSLKANTNSWQHRARQTILTWLNKLGFNWETTDTIQLRQISPDGQRILREQTFAANYAEISPDGNYLILMSQMKNESRNIVYRYPTQLNWFHALTWPTIPTALLLLLQRKRQRTSPLATGKRSQG